MSVASLQPVGRGPNRAGLALDRLAETVIAYRDAGTELLRRRDHLLAAIADARSIAGVDVRLELERELSVVLDMGRGLPFWDRAGD